MAVKNLKILKISKVFSHEFIQKNPKILGNSEFSFHNIFFFAGARLCAPGSKHTQPLHPAHAAIAMSANRNKRKTFGGGRGGGADKRAKGGSHGGFYQGGASMVDSGQRGLIVSCQVRARPRGFRSSSAIRH
jgi:hypothetical protein